MLPILILGGAAAAALFLSGCQTGSEVPHTSSNPKIFPPSGQPPDPEVRFAQGVKPLVPKISENRSGALSSSAALFTPGGATALLNPSPVASPASSIGDFYRQREYQKTLQDGVQEDPTSDFYLALGAKVLADPPPASEPLPAPEPLPAAPRKITTNLPYQPRFDLD